MKVTKVCMGRYVMETVRKTMLSHSQGQLLVLKNIENQLKTGEKTAMEVYRENISDSSIQGVHQGVMNARNLKQVENIVKKSE